MEGVRYATRLIAVLAAAEVAVYWVLSRCAPAVLQASSWPLDVLGVPLAALLAFRMQGKEDPTSCRVPAGRMDLFPSSARQDGTSAVRALVLINTISGAGQAAAMVKNHLVPSLVASKQRYQLEICYTKSREHVQQLARQHDPDDTPLIIIASGDGLVHDWINSVGISDGRLAATTFAFLPAGTGNGMASSCGGPAAAAAARLIPLQATSPLDMMHVTWLDAPADSALASSGQPLQVPSGFLAAASARLGVIAEYSVLTERTLRWLGPLRLGLASALSIIRRPAPRLRLAWRPITTCVGPARSPASDGWVTLEGRFTLLELVVIPRLAHDVHFAPHRRLGDHAIDLIFAPDVSRLALIKMLVGLETAAHLRVPGIEYTFPLFTLPC